MKLRVATVIDSRPPFDGERYWRWDVYRESDIGKIVFAMGWSSTKWRALKLARFVRQELRRIEGL